AGGFTSSVGAGWRAARAQFRSVTGARRESALPNQRRDDRNRTFAERRGDTGRTAGGVASSSPRGHGHERSEFSAAGARGGRDRERAEELPAGESGGAHTGFGHATGVPGRGPGTLR